MPESHLTKPAISTLLLHLNPEACRFRSIARLIITRVFVNHICHHLLVRTRAERSQDARRCSTPPAHPPFRVQYSQNITAAAKRRSSFLRAARNARSSGCSVTPCNVPVEASLKLLRPPSRSRRTASWKPRALAKDLPIVPFLCRETFHAEVRTSYRPRTSIYRMARMKSLPIDTICLHELEEDYFKFLTVSCAGEATV